MALSRNREGIIEENVRVSQLVWRLEMMNKLERGEQLTLETLVEIF